MTSAFADVCRSVRQIGRTASHQFPHRVRSSGVTDAESPTGLFCGCSLPTEALLAIMNTHGSATPRPRFLARSQDPTGPPAPAPPRAPAPHEGAFSTAPSLHPPLETESPPEPGWFTVTRHLSTRTVAWLANRPRARELVDSVWDTLTDLERAGHHPGVIAALRFVLVHHQPPTPTGRCPHCRCTWRRLWCRRRWPCVVWRQVHHELLGPFARSAHHRQRPQTT